MSSSLYIVDKCSCGALCKSRLIFISSLNIIQEPASKKVSLAEPTFTIPAAAEKAQKPKVLENLQMRRGSLAKPKHLEEIISENSFLGAGSRRGSLAQTKILENAILEMETLGAGSRRGSLADIIPDWPTLKPFEKVAKSKVLKSATFVIIRWIEHQKCNRELHAERLGLTFITKRWFQCVYIIISAKDTFWSPCCPDQKETERVEKC